MAVREILKMGDARLLRIAKPVQRFDTPELHALVADMFDTMRAAEGAGLGQVARVADVQQVEDPVGHDQPPPLRSQPLSLVAHLFQ